MKNATDQNTRALVKLANDVIPPIMQRLQSEAYTHFYNVCIETPSHPAHAIHDRPFQAELTAYDSTKPATSYTYHVDTAKRQSNNFWKVHTKSGEIPGDAVYNKDVVMLFPTFWRNSQQIFLFLGDTLPWMLAQIQWTRQQRRVMTSTNKNTSRQQNDLLLMAPRLRNMPQTFVETFAVLGIRQAYDFSTIKKQNESVCFSNAVFGKTLQLKSGHERKVRRLLEQNMNFSTCPQYYVTFLQRQKTRKILNIYQLMELTKLAGLENIRLEYFEGRTIPQQMHIIHCTAVFVGVQGAALAWYPFLAKHAALLEIVYPGWPTHYQRHVQWYRPDVQAITVPCERVTPDDVWAKYAKLWYNISGRAVSRKMKLKLLQRSDEMYPIGRSVYKDSDCRCLNQTFTKALLDALPNIVNGRH